MSRRWETQDDVVICEDSRVSDARVRVEDNLVIFTNGEYLHMNSAL